MSSYRDASTVPAAAHGVHVQLTHFTTQFAH
jgi:hypothetical protein